MGTKRRVSLKVISVDKTQEAALVESIAHWGRMRDGKAERDETPSSLSCACCRAFLRTGERMCERCPISEMTGKVDCGGTPWRAASSAFFNTHYGSERFRKAADAEVKFLDSCLAWVRAGKPT